ncbi:TonB-dependent receptor [Sphingomonas fuzhouensis]|uniref:TonB-dependent receptor n=1 Tax=Sphingomonas fuzhouensis TaxID=3106033 RepID=UPI002AFE54B1|nr:carboxypeptidase regulatory-like domain-containing protein [Sphingomonas sp. SGZ-02]
MSAAAAIVAASGLTVIAAPVAAQGYVNVIAGGSVTDAAGKPIAGATVTVTSDAQGFTRSATTDRDGSYQIPELPPGSYSFTISAPGYATYREDNVALTAGSSSNRFALGAESTSGEITVSGKRIRTSDFDSTTTGAVIDVADIATRLPVGRDLQSVILLAPGANAGAGAFGGLPSISGASVSENAFFVNGLNITDFRRSLGAVTVPFDFYQNVEVKTGGYAAEFGRSTGGFINATTKSGSNEFHGGILFSWNPNDLRSATKDTIYTDNKHGRYDAATMTAELSGPLWKDHLFFYGLYQARNINSVFAGRQYFPATNTFLGTSRTFYRTASPFFGGKIDAVITSGQRLEFTYFNTTGEGTSTYYGNTNSLANRWNPVTGRDGPYQGYTYGRYGGANYVGRYTGVMSKWLTLSAAYGRNENISYGQSINASNSTLPPVTDARTDQAISLTNPGGAINSSKDVRKFYRGDVDVYFKALGMHHVRFGYDREELLSDVQTLGSGGGIGYTILRGRAGDQFGVPVGTDYVRQSNYAVGGGFRSLNDAFYAQDSWSLMENRLNLNLGLRLDRFTNRNGDGAVFYKSGNQWGPRLGFTFDPIGNQTDKFYGSFSRLYMPVAANTNIRLAGGETFYWRTNLFGGLGPNNIPILGAPVLYSGAVACPDTGIANCDVTGTGRAPDTRGLIAQGLKPQSADEWIFGYSKRVDRWRFETYLTITRLNEVLEDAAIDRAVNNYCAAQKIAGCDKIWGGFHQYVLINPGRGGPITLSDPINGESTPRTVNFSAADLGYVKAERFHRSMTFRAVRDFDGVWSLEGSYVYGKTYGNYEGGVKSDNGQGDTGLTQDFDQPGLQRGMYGYSPNDRRHVFKLFGSYQFGLFNVGASFSAAAPRKYGCIGTVPRSVDPYARAYGAAGAYCQVKPDGTINTDPLVAYPVQLVRRGTAFDGRWLFTDDIDISTKIPIGRSNATLRLTVFNFLNLKTPTNFNEFGTTGNGTASIYYRTVTGYQGGRNARLQFQYAF